MAYDSVPHEALWKVLGKLGVPEVLINIVRSFHENMTAQIRLDGELLKGIDVNNGLRQECTIAPTLFNLYSCAVTERWLSRIKFCISWTNSCSVDPPVGQRNLVLMNVSLQTMWHY